MPLRVTCASATGSFGTPPFERLIRKTRPVVPGAPSVTRGAGASPSAARFTRSTMSSVTAESASFTSEAFIAFRQRLVVADQVVRLILGQLRRFVLALALGHGLVHLAPVAVLALAVLLLPILVRHRSESPPRFVWLK